MTVCYICAREGVIDVRGTDDKTGEIHQISLCDTCANDFDVVDVDATADFRREVEAAVRRRPVNE